MAEKRRDNKGRVLQKGEGQRKDLTYQYRFQNKLGKRITVYAPTLKELREKEAEITKQIITTGQYSKGEVTILEMMERYLRLNRRIKTNTRKYYEDAIKQFKKYPFSNALICDLKVTDVKLWVVEAHESGASFSSVNKMLALMKPSLEIAVEEDVIVKNPCRFKLSDVIRNEATPREALTPEQQQKWLTFIKSDRYCKRIYDTVVILLGTGMRASEFCGLTVNDVDFDNRTISVNHQLFKKDRSQYFIETPKSSKGNRIIPMTDDVYDSLQRLVSEQKRRKVELIIDGYHGFITLNLRGNPQTYYNIDYSFQTAMKRYREQNPNDPIPKITPHVLRHTYCTNLINAGISTKSVQYLMGHSSVSVTLDRYAHNSFEQATKELAGNGIIPANESMIKSRSE